MAIRTEGVGAERALQFWDQYGVKKYDFLPTEMVTPGPVTFEFEKLLLTDTGTPVGNILLKCVDAKLKLRNAADDANVILDEIFIPHTLASEFTFTDLVKFARPANEPSVRIGDAGQGYQILQFSKKTGGDGHANLEVEDETSALVLSAGLASAAWSPAISLVGIDQGGADAGCMMLRSAKTLAGGTDYYIERLKLGIGAIADATWAAILQSGLKLKDALDANSQKITNLDAPVAQDDALRKQRGEIIETDVDTTEIEVLSHRDILNGYCPLDASVLVPLANIPTPLTGKDADTVDGVEGADIIVRGGTVTFTANQPLGGFKLTGLGAPTDPNDAARLTDVATGGGGAYGTAGDVTVAAGAVTITGHHYKVDAAGAADLNTVTAGVGVAEGWMVVLRAKDIANPITCKDGVGNLRLQSDFTLDSLEDSIMIIYDGTNWLEVARSNNS